MRSQSAIDCTSNCLPQGALAAVDWSPPLCQQVEIVTEKAINQKTELMKGEINKAQTKKTRVFLNSLPDFC